jgi:uncharacterized protein
MNKPEKNSKPWYREPWPWILMTGPAVVVVAGIVTTWLAVRSNDGLVADDYYKQGLAVKQQMARDHEAAGLGLTAELMVGGDGHELRLFLSAREGVALPPALLFRATHPTRAGGDQTVKLERNPGGFYIGRLAEPLQGRWHVMLEDEARQWRLTGDWNLAKQPALRLPAAATSTSNDKGS